MSTMETVRQKEVGMLKNKIERANTTKELIKLTEGGMPIHEAAEKLGINESTARAWIASSDGKTIKIGVHDAHWILTALIHNWKPDEEK